MRATAQRVEGSHSATAATLGAVALSSSRRPNIFTLALGSQGHYNKWKCSYEATGCGCAVAACS